MTIAIMGGGIQGCTTALALVDRGFDVLIVDAASALMSAASRHNEGKIHLGYVYAGDPTLRTARLMMHGAAVFQPLLQRWLGPMFGGLPVSTGFNYALHRDSQRSCEQLALTYQAISAMAPNEMRTDGRYMGSTNPQHLRRLDPEELCTYGANIVAGFETAEVAIEPNALADALAQVVNDDPRVDVATDTSVISVDSAARTIRVRSYGGSERSLGPFDHIVNCAWRGRPSIDATAGLLPPARWSFRMKYFVRVDLGDTGLVIPSTTVVLGSFGDIVDFGHGDHYVSWYPAGRRGWSTDLLPPDWPSHLNDGESELLAREIFTGMADIVPVLGFLASTHAERSVVRGGVIYALGDTDLVDPSSRLHQRHEVGPTSLGRYHTVDTGKLTLAPLFAEAVAERIRDAER